MTDENQRDDQRVDPRYDPAFQRGFDGPVTTGQRARSGARSADRSALAASASLRQVESARPLESIRPVARVEPEPMPDAVPDAVPDTAPDATLDADDVSPRRLARNPFLIALVVLGLVMTVGGIAWANQARMLVAVRGGAATDLDYWFLQSSVVAAPLTIIAGIGILAGVLFIAASAWNRR